VIPTSWRRFALSAFLLFAALTIAAGAVSIRNGQGSAETSKTQSADSPVGTWRGESTCVVKPSGCHDEDSVYRISETAQSPNKLNLSGNKIVDGKEVNMGSGDCVYNAKSGTIDCPLPNGNSIHLEAEGKSMQGTMTLKDGTLWRKISLHKVEEK